jgi:hypothetical protein
LLYDATLSPKEISGFVAHLFDKGMPTTRSSSVSMPFSSDNPPPLVRIFDFFKSILDSHSYESILIIHQDLYPAHPVDAEVFDSTHDGQDDPMCNDDGGQGAPSAEPIVPHLIGSDMVTQVLPSATNQATTAAPLRSGPSKKKRLMLASKRKQPAPSDHVTTELFSRCVPRCSPGLVVIKLVFVCLFEALNAPLRLPRSTLLLGLTFSQPKDFGRLR